MNENNHFNPNWYSSPSATILDLIELKSLSLEIFAKQLNSTMSSVKGLIRGEVPIDEKLAVQLEEVIGGSCSFWMQRQENYIKEKRRIFKIKESHWIDSLPIKEMISRGWINKEKDSKNECLDFFGISNFQEWGEYKANLASSVFYRESQKLNSVELSNLAWIRNGEREAKKKDCNKYNEEVFEEILEEIKPLTREKKPAIFLPILIEKCALAGVALIISPTIKGSRASGATKFVSSDKAMLLLSFRFLSDDHFWFTFYHEAGHILMHKKNSTFVEVIGKSQDIESQEEREANMFASEMLIPSHLKTELQYLRSNRRKIIQFAQKAGISPGIVIGQMQHLGIIKYEYLNSYKRRYAWDEIMKSL